MVIFGKQNSVRFVNFSIPGKFRTFLDSHYDYLFICTIRNPLYEIRLTKARYR